MNTLQQLTLLVSFLLISACSNIRIGFDEFPDGTVVPAWDGAGAISSFLISTQYASEGVAEFTSDVNGVLPIQSNDTPSSPNMVCPRNTAGTYTADTNITLTQSTCNIWINLRGPSQVTVTAYDHAGINLGSTSGHFGQVRINNCGIRRVKLTSGGPYCFDDFTWQKR